MPAAARHSAMSSVRAPYTNAVSARAAACEERFPWHTHLMYRPPRPRPCRPRTSAPSMSSEEPAGALLRRPVRAAIALTWLLVVAYVVELSPGSFDSMSPDSLDNQLIMKAFADPSALNPLFFFIFNSLGILPGVNLALLLPGAMRQPLPTAPFVAASFALGFGAVGPYLALRQPRPEPVRASELGFFTRNVTESRLYAGGLFLASLALTAGLFAALGDPAVMSEFATLFATSKLVHVSTIDFAILSAFAFDPIREDMSRRGWWKPGSGGNNVGRLLAFSMVPLLGPAAYLLARPPLEK